MNVLIFPSFVRWSSLVRFANCGSKKIMESEIPSSQVPLATVFCPARRAVSTSFAVKAA